jgi:hypothetical protein
VPHCAWEQGKCHISQLQPHFHPTVMQIGFDTLQ